MMARDKWHADLTDAVIFAGARRSMFGSGNGVGFCIMCGAEVSAVEPDAIDYPCEGCGAPDGVVGAELLLFMVVP